ncbi:MAG: hypothetical protein CMM94_04155 [Rickettsiales bacterium]|nr:hypothetical protein [Rickettsiales bacterium]
MPRKLLLICLLMIALIAAAYTHFAHNLYYQWLIPSKLEIDNTLFVDVDLDWYAGGCGVAVYSLKPAIVSAINTKGIHFFDDALSAEEVRIFSKNRTVKYEDWQETPIPSNMFEGWPVGFTCASTSRKALFNEIVAHLHKPNSFFSRTDRGRLIFIIPEMEIIVFTFFN